MTKEEVRVVTLSKLRISKTSIIVDIGAGTGSISIEASLLAPSGRVYAVEKDREAINLIRENALEFDIPNMEIIEGEAPEVLPAIAHDRVILGGSGGKLEEIMDWVDLNLKEEGRIVINAITIETLYNGINSLKKRKYRDIDVTQLSVSKGFSAGNYTMMKGQNPVYIISANRW